jgi:hypothetical protein
MYKVAKIFYIKVQDNEGSEILAVSADNHQVQEEFQNYVVSAIDHYHNGG